MNIYLKNELVTKLIEAGIKDIPKFVNDAVEEKLSKEEN